MLGWIGIIFVLTGLYYHYSQLYQPLVKKEPPPIAKRIQLSNPEMPDTGQQEITNKNESPNKIPPYILNIFQEQSMSPNSGFRIGDVNPRTIYNTLN